MNARDELVRALDERNELAEALRKEGAWCGSCDFEMDSDCPDCNNVLRRYADAILAAGFRKVDPAAETRTEWAIHDHLDGVTSPVGQLNAEERTRMFAKHRPHISVRSRDVITTPWREVES